MSNIYIDLGCYDGDTVEQFRNWRQIAFPDKEWKIYAFDPNPAFAEAWLNKVDKETEFIEQAAWVESGTMELAVDVKRPLGSTIMKSKQSMWENSNVIEVSTFDFSEWIEQFKFDFVVVKMDIEGAEFPILDKMLSDGTAEIMDYLLVETHPNKVVDYTTTDANDLLDRLRQLGIRVYKWH